MILWISEIRLTRKEPNMFRTFKTMVDIFWIMDVLDLPFMEMFDTTYPINGVFWFAVILVLCFEEAFELNQNRKGDK